MLSNRFQRRRALMQAGASALGMQSAAFGQAKTIELGFVSPQARHLRHPSANR